MSLQEQANKLEKDGGLDGIQIQHKLNTILQRKQQIKNLSQSRREKLQTALLLALFYQNLAEVRNLDEGGSGRMGNCLHLLDRVLVFARD